MTTNTVAVTDVIHSLKDLQQRFNLQQATDDNFFPEWQEPRPELTVQERAAIGQIKQRYDYHRLDGLLLEGTVDLIVVSPLLAVAGLLDPPFRIKSPHGITLELPDPEMPIKGFIDARVVQERLWILTLEAKRTSIPVPAALPQLLAYLLAAPQPNLPTFGMATNGDEFIFLKLLWQDVPIYDVSKSFSAFPRHHELAELVQVLKGLGQIIGP
jgi:hypothetical protein